MKDVWENNGFIRILLLGMLIALLGIFPLSKVVTTGYDGIRHAQERSQYERVANQLSIVAEQQPWRSGVWEAAGNAALKAGNAENAGDYFARAAAKGDLSMDGYIAWGDADWQRENYHTALQIWTIAEQLGADPNEISERRVEVYRVLGDDLALIKTLQSMLIHPSIKSYPAATLGVLNHELGLLLAAYEPASAPTYLSRAAELDPALDTYIQNLNLEIQQGLLSDDPVYLYMIAGRALANYGNWGFAEKAFENAADLQPDYVEAWAYLGEARQHTETGDEPLAALETALRLDPDSVAANTFLALYWQRKGENELALKFLQNASRQDPDNPAYLVEIGKLVALLGDLKAGEAYYWQAVTLSSNDPRYLREYLYFSIQFNLNLRDTVLPMTRKLVMSDPENPVSLDLIGEVLLQLGDWLNAERFFLRALEKDPDYDQAHLHLGEFYRNQGKTSLARYHLSRVIETTRNQITLERAQQTLDPNPSP
jgi:tetratricopeptide (TPR) repeat protein